jgi:hypothetical protein
MTNKVYISGYRYLNNDEITLPKRPFEPLEDAALCGGVVPSRIFSERSEAEGICAELRGMNFHDGPHRCNFLVESLDGGFVIVCLDHPTDLSLSPAK